MTRPTLALTMGDPAGVGPELVLKALNSERIQRLAQLVVFGDQQIINQVAESLELQLPNRQWLSLSELSELDLTSSDHLLVQGCPTETIKDFLPARVQACCGEAAFQFIQRAIDCAQSGLVDGIVTAPINKEALHLAKHFYPGHTEMFAERCAPGDWCMMQTAPELTCTFVTVHIGYAEVPQALSVDNIFATIKLTHQALLKMHHHQPRILVCGLNPHAGENGLFGAGEEKAKILPAVQKAQAQGICIEGPVPPDTAFLPNARKDFDAVVCMYHDQGHIPIKALAFDSAVNTTLGLDLIRTSVDHGTAFDIAWQGVASSASLESAIRLGSQLATRA